MNKYDKHDMVDRLAEMRAGHLKLTAYRVRDPDTMEWSPIQFHILYGNHVMGMMSEQSAKLYARFVTDTLAAEAKFKPEGEAKNG